MTKTERHLKCFLLAAIQFLITRIIKYKLLFLSLLNIIRIDIDTFILNHIYAIFPPHNIAMILFVHKTVTMICCFF